MIRKYIKIKGGKLNHIKKFVISKNSQKTKKKKKQCYYNIGINVGKQVNILVVKIWKEIARAKQVVYKHQAMSCEDINRQNSEKQKSIIDFSSNSFILFLSLTFERWLIFIGSMQKEKK